MIEGLQLNCAKERARIVSFIRERLTDAGYSRLVVGLSGGVDSALTAALSVEAVGPENVCGIMLPYATFNPHSEAHARLVAEHLGILCEHFEITEMVEPLLARCPEIDERRKGNIMARCRMIALFDQSVRFQGLVVGTSNRTEFLLGYFTIYGDGAASLKPIGHLYKCQVRDLAQHVGVPEAVISKAPSADLWTGQTDEGELGFTYDEADQILYLLSERGLSPEQVIARGFEARVVGAILHRMHTTEFKRQLPPMLSVDGRAAL
ncbi:MAG: hypothetical protein A2Y73_01200 [Chloroflexi bacterium RBG_13_56_8]|nr:MAG: hypothetical protein A2Y73_01200 [Chloroflexi bacterium RBG_13_56_8]